MKTERQQTERFLQMQDHPEQVTDEQLLQALSDPQMRELVGQMAFAKRAFKNKELQETEPDVEEEWVRFVTKNHCEGNHTEPNSSLFTLRSSFQKIAASFIGLLFISGIAFAAIHIARHYRQQETLQVADTTAVPNSSLSTHHPSQPKDTTAMQPVVFDNAPLERMLPEIAAYYHAEASFLNDDARQLRFHFVWKRDDGLVRTIKKLNRFESVSIRLDEGDGEHTATKIIVE